MNEPVGFKERKFQNVALVSIAWDCNNVWVDLDGACVFRAKAYSPGKLSTWFYPPHVTVNSPTPGEQK